MKIVGNLLCAPNYNYIHIDGDWSPDALYEPWAMFAVMDHTGGGSQRVRVKASGMLAVRIKKLDPEKGDFVRIEGFSVAPMRGSVYVYAESFEILKRSKAEGKDDG